MDAPWLRNEAVKAEAFTGGAGMSPDLETACLEGGPETAAFPGKPPRTTGFLKPRTRITLVKMHNKCIQVEMTVPGVNTYDEVIGSVEG